MPSGEVSADSRHSISKRILLAQTVLGTVTSLLFVGRKNFWLDEGYSFEAAHRQLGDLWRMVTHDQSVMGPYYFALHFWLALGRSEAVLRLLSVPFAIATVPLVALLAARLYERRTGVVAGFLAAVNVMLVTYAQEARAYSMLLFLAAASALLFVELVRRPRRGLLVAWMLVSAFAVYVHYMAALLVVAELVSLAALSRDRWPKGVVLASLGVLVLDAPVVVFVVWRGPGPLASAGRASILDPGRLLFRFAGSVPLAVLAAALVVVAGVVAIGKLRRNAAGLDRWAEVFPWLALLLPPAALLLGALVHPLWRERYLIESLPAFVVLVARGVTGLAVRPLRTAAMVVLAALTAVALVSYYSPTVKQDADWRAATLFVHQHARASDGVWFVPSTAYVPSLYYSWKRGQPPLDDLGLTARPLAGRLHPLPLPQNAIAARARRYTRVWVVLLVPNLDQAGQVTRRQARLVSRLLVGFRFTAERRFGPLLTVLCLQRS